MVSYEFEGRTIYQANFRDSASKINKKQFLLLCVVYRQLHDAGELFEKYYSKYFMSPVMIRLLRPYV